MEINVKKSDLDQLSDQDKEKISDIIKNGFSGRGIDQELGSIDFSTSSVTSSTLSSSACDACDAGFAAVLLGCNALPPPANGICITGATLAYKKCRENNNC